MTSALWPAGPSATQRVDDRPAMAALPGPGPLATLLGQVAIAGNLVFGFNVFQQRPSFWTLMALPALGCVVLTPGAALLRMRISVPALLLLAWMAMSLAWTADLGATVLGVRTSLPPLLGLVAVAGLLPARNILSALRWTVWLVIGAQVVALLADPGGSMLHGEGVVTGWRGTFLSKNGFAAFATVAAAIALPAERGWRRLVLVVALAALLVGSNSWTGRGAAVVVVLAWSWLSIYIRRRPGQSAPLALLTAAAVVAAGTTIYLSFDTAVSAVGKDATFTGRTAVWEAALDVISRRPLTGHGLRAFMNPDQPTGPTLEVWDRIAFEAPHAHNGYLDAAGELGLVGVALAVTILLLVVRRAFTALDLDPVPAAVILLVVVAQLVFTVSEPYLLGGGWTVLLVLLAGWSLRLGPAGPGSAGAATAAMRGR